ncbi:MAG: hypothetical protein HY329_05650 [Chloroflexi bacterium]|nr:hypothetical protein [Chloroflexota bacterium]
MTFITEPFAPKTRREVEVKGVPALPTVILDHPIGQSAADIVRAAVEPRIDELVSALTDAPEVVADRYRGLTKKLESTPRLTDEPARA